MAPTIVAGSRPALEGAGFLDVDKSEVDQRQGRAEQGRHYESAHKDHEQVTDPDGNAIVGLNGVVGQQVAQDATAIERRNREKVEEEKREVDEDSQTAKQGDRLHRQGGTRAEGGDEGRLNQSAAVGKCDGHDRQDAEGDKDKHDVRDRSGQSGEVVVADDLAEVARNDRSGLGPANQEAAEEGEPDEGPEDDEPRKQQRSDGVHMEHGVERDAAFETGGLVAEARGHPCVSTLVKAERKQQ